MTAFVEYEEKKKKLIAALQKSGQEIALQKSTSNLFRPAESTKNHFRLDVRAFNHVISVDLKQLVAEVEGMTPYETLVNETLKYGCLPTVVPELKTITVGGAISGCGIEASSYRYGLVHETVIEMEVLLADGTVTTCSKEQNSDLFYAIPNTYGTIGYVLKAKVSLIPAKPYVKLTRQAYDNSVSFFKDLEKFCERGTDDYIDGVIFDENQQVITLANFSETAPYTSNYRFMQIYYKSMTHKQEDFLTTVDYIWRYDVDWFWGSKTFYMHNPIIRFLLGKWMLDSRVYTKLMNFFHRHNWLRYFWGRQESVIQDIVIPIEGAEYFYSFLRQEIGIKPIWICPYKSFSSKQLYDFCPLDPNQLYFDFGFWDSIPTKEQPGFYNRKIEKLTQKLNGFKSLYSSSYYPEEEFWHIFNKRRYQELKSKYDPLNRLGDLYVKSNVR